ncbi:MAG: right-handed parallel beta-helix repeat-containing protein [Clostridiales bacterium]|nr:right-handed parallel beta-helix repeat-containing protein [Clostridiales bacterium]
MVKKRTILSLMLAVVLVFGMGLAVQAETINVPDEYGTIQEAINNAQAGDTIEVAEGTYTEQIVINKNLTLKGEGSPTIKAPDDPDNFTIPENSKQWEPVMFAFGGTLDEETGEVTGDSQVEVNIFGFTVDGDERVPSERAAGILLRNVVSTGSISNNTIQNFDLTQETFGIQAYGNSNLTISGNTVTDYGRGGIVANGEGCHAVITDNTVEGVYPDIPTGWAINGIQIGYGATGKIRGNEVSGNGWPGEKWAGSGILGGVYSSDNVLVEDNTVSENEIGIGVMGKYMDPQDPSSDNIIRNNTVDSNEEGISIQSPAEDNVVEGNTITNNDYGVAAVNYGEGVSGTAVHYNNIYGNSQYGVEAAGEYGSPAPTVDATHNYWGDETGPGGEGTGEGDAVSGNVDYLPFYPKEDMEIPTHPAEAYDSVDEAVEAAEEGDTVEVSEDQNKSVTVSNSGIILLGKDKPTVNKSITVTGDNNTVKNFNFDVADGETGLLVGGSNNTVKDNKFEGHSGTGIEITADETGTTIEYADFLDLDIGILIDEDAGADNVVQNSNFIENDIAVQNNSAYLFDATDNWWDDKTGPYHEELNPEGKGDEVEGDASLLKLSPWLEHQVAGTPEGEDTTSPVIEAWIEGFTLYVEVTDDYNLDEVEITVDGNTTTYQVSGTQDTVTRTLTDEAGAYEIEVVAFDEKGNQAATWTAIYKPGAPDYEPGEGSGFGFDMWKK